MPETRKYSDRAEYLKKAVTKKRKTIKERALQQLGGQCIYCGYSKYQGALEFHHKVATTKEFGIGQKGHSRSWSKVLDELEKCILVCSNCHKEVHAGLRSIPE
ncbi:TPA: hypothetical protein DCG61_00805 [Patescibacteria group bacterium]|jgi:5-methylcytosine-specific restriction endonuclease McrA|nr:hypothetical protein [Patescibacteria group bacterium]